MKTLPELAQQVLDVQDACNLSGVVHAWSAAITNLRELMPTAGTEVINRHPINKLWADKVAHLTGTQNLLCQEVDDAYGVVSEMAASKSGPVEVMPTCPCCGAERCDCAPTFPGEVEFDQEAYEEGQSDQQQREDEYNADDFKRDYPNGEPLKDSMHPEGI